MWDKLKGRFTPRRSGLIVALAAIVVWAGWRMGAFEGQPPQKPCEAGRPSCLTAPVPWMA